MGPLHGRIHRLFNALFRRAHKLDDAIDVAFRVVRRALRSAGRTSFSIATSTEGMPIAATEIDFVCGVRGKHDCSTPESCRIAAPQRVDAKGASSCSKFFEPRN
jgi:hypothetical protein